MKTRLIIVLTYIIVIAGCASTPQGPGFNQLVLPEPSEDEGLLVVFRDYAEPTGLVAKILGPEDSVLFALPQKSFAYVLLAPGEHSVEVKWPALSGTPGWSGKVEVKGGEASYYQLVGSTGSGFYFKSSLKPLSPELAGANLNLCCKLVTEMKDQAKIKTEPTDTQPAHKQLANKRGASIDKDKYFDSLEVGMLPEQVIKLVGAPSKMANKSTGKMWIPFYFGPDTRRTYWSYKGIGYVVFTRNDYTASEKLIEVKYDPDAP